MRGGDARRQLELEGFFTESASKDWNGQGTGGNYKKPPCVTHAARYKYAVLWYMINKIGAPRKVRGIMINELTAKELAVWLGAGGACSDGGPGLSSVLHDWQDLPAWKAIVGLARKESRWMGEGWLGDGEEPEPEVRLA